MSNLDKRYAIRLDTKKKYYNTIPKFSISDTETSDFYIKITNDYKLVDINNAIVTMCYIDPNNSIDVAFIDVVANETGVVYCNLKPSQKNKLGTWKARLLITLGEEKIVTDSFTYQVENDEFVTLNQEIVEAEKYQILTEMISRLSTIELSELSRVKAELSREEAEKLRQEAIEKVKTDITKLIEDTNSKVDTNLKENSNKVDKLISATTTKIDNYTLEKDAAINLDLQQYKKTTTQDIDNYKEKKDLEIDKDLNDYKTATTKNIDDYKNAKDTEINDYKAEKDLEIDTYVANKNKELDNYKLAKNTEINEFKDLKDTEINAKLKEVDTAEQSRVVAEQKRAEDHQAREQFLNGFESQLEQIETKNIEQDNRLKDIEYKNKVQDVYIGGLFNENADGRLTIEDEGNDLKLEGSKQGLVEVEKVTGNTLVNCRGSYLRMGTKCSYDVTTGVGVIDAHETFTQIEFNNDLIQDGREYTIIIDIDENTLEGQVSPVKVVLGSDITGGYFDIKANQTGRFIKYMPSITKTLSVAQVKIRATTGGRVVFSNFIILEGDYTNKPIPSEYFEGMQSTFEDKLITQEMVDSGLEKAENLGKYKCNVRVVGKNKCDNAKNKLATIDLDTGVETQTNGCVVSDFILVYRDYSCTKIDDGNKFNSLSYIYYDMNKKYLGSTKPNFYPYYVRLRALRKSTDINVSLNDIKFQLEEGTQATEYEPYKEYKTSILLGSPLLKGDEIVVKEDGLYHYHNKTKRELNGNESGWSQGAGGEFYLYGFKDVATNKLTDKNEVICNKYPQGTLPDEKNSNSQIILYNHGGTTGGQVRIIDTKYGNVEEFKNSLKENPLTLIYDCEPYFEKISDDKFVSEIPNDATLHIDSTIPCQSVKANYTGKLPSVYGLEETNKNQDNLIDISLCATDEMYMMIEPLLSAVPQTMSERMVSKMVDMYVAMVIRGLKTIDEVPARYREEVKEILAKLEK